MSTLLDIRGLRVHYPLRTGLVASGGANVVRAVDGVDLDVSTGEVVGLVGESGCGKSTLARAVLRIVPPTAGEVWFEGVRIDNVPESRLRPMRTRLQMVFQDPYASLNPRMTVFDALAEPMLVHGLARRRDVAGRVAALMEQVGLAARFMRKYPHEFSGGQRQRIAIARALALDPRLIIADEPVSALDVSVQAQILNLLARLRAERGLAMVLIAHDLSVVRYASDRAVVMYLGKVVEAGPAGEVFERPRHPYTMALASAVPLPDPTRERTRRRVLLKGEPPSPVNPPSGCAFHTRCAYAVEGCARKCPPLLDAGPDRRAACVRLDAIHGDAFRELSHQDRH